MLFFLYGLCLIFGHKATNAQEQNHLFIGSQYHVGSVLAHTNEIKYIVNEPIRGGHINLTWKTNGSKYWHNAYRNPYYGVGFYHSNLGNIRHYGKIYGFYPFMIFPITDNQRKMFLNYRIACGYSFIDKTYDIENNLLNVAIGTHSNIYIHFGFEVSFQIIPDLYWDSDLNFIHASNGKVQSPNLGLNMGTLSTGLRYRIIQGQKVDEPEFKAPVYDQFFHELSWAFGVRTPGKYVYQRYFATSLVYDFGIRTSYKRSFGIGTDLFYDRSIRVSIKNDGREDVKDIQLYKAGLHIFHDIYIGDLIVTLQLGHHVYSKFREFTNLYTRTGLKYNISERLWTKFSLKAHYFNADFIEWGVGYRW
jgi:hypothetical protein